MWRLVLITFSFSIFWALPAAADEATDGFECITCQENCEEYGVERGERFCVVEAQDSTTPPDTTNTDPAQQTQEDPQQDAAPQQSQFLTALIEWEFIPVIEAISAEGAVSAVDVQRTIQQDQTAISNCFDPQSYPGDGIVDVEVYLSYNGVPTSVNGNTDGVSPNQARCILKRAWNYEFPRLAEDADTPSRVSYRVQFVPQRRGVPDTDPFRGQLLLERVSTQQSDLRSPIASQLYTQLATAQRCASLTTRELPTDLIVTEVDMTWRRSGETYIPADVDITVTNQTGTQLPSNEVLQCFERTLTMWDIQLQESDLPQLQSNFFITLRPAGWHGS